MIEFDVSVKEDTVSIKIYGDVQSLLDVLEYEHNIEGEDVGRELLVKLARAIRLSAAKKASGFYIGVKE